MSELPFQECDVRYRVTKDDLEAYRTGKFDDIPDEAVVVATPNADGGIVIYSRYKDQWMANPWGVRHMIRALLDR